MPGYYPPPHMPHYYPYGPYHPPHMAYYPPSGFYGHPYPYQHPFARGPMPDYHSTGSNSHSNPNGYFGHEMPSGQGRPRSVYVPYVEGPLGMYGQPYAHSTHAMGQGSHDRSQERSYSHIGTYSYPFNHSYPHPHGSFSRHYNDPMRAHLEQSPFMVAGHKQTGVTPVTPGFVSNKTSTPPHFE